MLQRLRLFLHFFLSPERILIGSFLFIILLGALALKLPFATHSGNISAIDALFTATSAVCVTGLIVVDTGNYFTLSGQIIILCLIQAGGLGIVTFSVLFYALMGMEIPLKGKIALEGTFSYEPLKNIFSIVKSVLLYTLVFETIGFALLFVHWLSYYPFFEALYLSVFHAVSAFCNAGFSPFAASLVKFRGDWWINLTVMFLIISGGIGFLVLYEIRKKFRTNQRLSLHTRIVVLTTLVLIFAGAALFIFTEWHNVLGELPLHEKVAVALFQSVTARTAGFNTIAIGSLNNATLFILILLMFVGASPGSCGGGIKTINLAILLSLSYNHLKGLSSAVMFKRTIPYETVLRSISLILGSFMFIILMLTIFLIFAENINPSQNLRETFLNTLFELTSAFGTVGLSTGLTPNLNTIGKIVIIVTMFTGRLGLLTLTFALAKKKIEGKIIYGEENVFVG